MRSLAAARAQLSLTQTVPRELAHRKALGEVFVADSAELGSDEFLVAIQIPRAHSLWFDRRAPYHDALALVEASRQGSFVLMHRHLGVPIGLPFTLHRVDFQVIDLEAFRDDYATPLEAIYHARLHDRQVRGDVLIGMTLRADLVITGAPAATLSGEIAFLPQREYDAMRAVQRARLPDARARQPLRRVDPARVGRIDSRNVVVGETDGPPRDNGEAFYPLVVDERHPSFYDHPQDHVPGPLLIEAYRQAAILTAQSAGALPSPVAAVMRCDATFGEFCEPEAPAMCSAAVMATSDGRVSLSVGLHQFDRRIADARIELKSYP